MNNFFKMIILAGLTYTNVSVAQKEKLTNFRVVVDWSKPASLNELVTQQCDDFFTPFVEIEVPKELKDSGYANPDLEMNVQITSGKLKPGCTVKKEEKEKSTIYTFNSLDLGGCTVKIDRRRTDISKKPSKVASIEIYPDC